MLVEICGNAAPEAPEHWCYTPPRYSEARPQAGHIPLAKQKSRVANQRRSEQVPGNRIPPLRLVFALTLLFAECSHDGRLRGLARWQDEPAADFRLTDGTEPVLAITIENATSGQRYQGLVPIEDSDLAVLFERYFERSEQLPTRIVLATDDSSCAGIMLQQLPVDAGGEVDADAWNRVGILLDTLKPAELSTLPAEHLLLRLFHEESARVYPSRPLAFGCRCSRERVAGMLRSLGRSEAEAAVSDNGAAEIICEFCKTRYRFDRIELDQIFRSDHDTQTNPTAH